MLDTNDLQLIKQTFNESFIDLKESINKIFERLDKLGNTDHAIEMTVQNEINDRKRCQGECASENNIIYGKIRESNKDIEELKKKLDEMIEIKRSWPTRLYESVSKIGRMILLLIAVFGAITGGLLALTTFLMQMGIIRGK